MMVGSVQGHDPYINQNQFFKITEAGTAKIAANPFPRFNSQLARPDKD
jgi:hypothetical protein